MRLDKQAGPESCFGNPGEKVNPSRPSLRMTPPPPFSRSPPRRLSATRNLFVSGTAPVRAHVFCGWHDTHDDVCCICTARSPPCPSPATTKVTKKSFKFAQQHDLSFFFVSAADGTNVVKAFEEAIKAGLEFKKNGGDFVDEALSLLEDT